MNNKVVECNGEKYEYLGNGCKATGADSGWIMSKELYFKCIGCGYFMNGYGRKSDRCPCGNLTKDSDYGRFGSRHGDDSIEVYRKV